MTEVESFKLRCQGCMDEHCLLLSCILASFALLVFPSSEQCNFGQWLHCVQKTELSIKQQNSIHYLLGTVTRQGLDSDGVFTVDNCLKHGDCTAYQLCSHHAAGHWQRWLHCHCVVIVPSRWLMELKFCCVCFLHVSMRLCAHWCAKVSWICKDECSRDYMGFPALEGM